MYAIKRNDVLELILIKISFIIILRQIKSKKKNKNKKKLWQLVETPKAETQYPTHACI